MAFPLTPILPGLVGLIGPVLLLYSKWDTENSLVRRVRDQALAVSAPLSRVEAIYLDRLVKKGVVCATQQGLYALDDDVFGRWSKRRSIAVYLLCGWIAGLVAATWLLNS